MKARIRLEQALERRDRIRVPAGSELGVRERQQQLGIVLEQPHARIVGDPHGFVEAPGTRQLVREPARRLDARVALVLERRLPNAAPGIDGRVQPPPGAACRHALIDRGQDLDDEIDQHPDAGKQEDQQNPPHLAARADHMHDRDALDNERDDG